MCQTDGRPVPCRGHKKVSRSYNDAREHQAHVSRATRSRTEDNQMNGKVSLTLPDGTNKSYNEVRCDSVGCER